MIKARCVSFLRVVVVRYSANVDMRRMRVFERRLNCNLGFMSEKKKKKKKKSQRPLCEKKIKKRRGGGSRRSGEAVRSGEKKNGPGDCDYWSSGRKQQRNGINETSDRVTRARRL